LCYFVAVILKALLVNLLAALNFTNVFFKNKNVWKTKKNVFLHLRLLQLPLLL